MAGTAALRLLACASLTGLTAACATPGYHYELGGFQQKPNDICVRLVNNAGAVSYINSSGAKPSGPIAPARTIVAASSDLPPGTDRSDGHLACHTTVVFAGGETLAGVLDTYRPSGDGPIHVTWLPDGVIEQRRIEAARISNTPGRRRFDRAMSECVQRLSILAPPQSGSGEFYRACAMMVPISP